MQKTYNGNKRRRNLSPAKGGETPVGDRRPREVNLRMTVVEGAVTNSKLQFNNSSKVQGNCFITKIKGCWNANQERKYNEEDQINKNKQICQEKVIKGHRVNGKANHLKTCARVKNKRKEDPQHLKNTTSNGLLVEIT